MEIVIPSMDRAQLQHTYANLPPRWQRQTTIIVPRRQLAEYRAAAPSAKIVGVDERLTGIGKLRQWILEKATASKICMMDDDLSFNRRRTDDLGKFTYCNASSINAMLSSLENLLGPLFPHGSICTREGGNRFATMKPAYNTRLLRVLAYHIPTWRKAAVRYDRIPLMEDFDVTLQLLRKGYANFLLTAWCQGQPGSNTTGGCSVYRTPKLQQEAALALKELHPDFVKVVQKKTKSSWNGQARTDVVISWKKAYESGCR